jgi:hypothetical protein
MSALKRKQTVTKVTSKYDFCHFFIDPFLLKI